MAVGFSLVALAAYVLGGPAVFEDRGRTFIGVIATYLAGGLCIGAIGGAVTPLMRSNVGFTLGAAFLGVLAYVAFQIEETGPRFWQHFDWLASAVFAAIGVGSGFAARARIRSRKA